MKDRYKFILAVLVTASLISCSFLKEKFSSGAGEDKKEETKEKMVDNGSAEDLDFYNKYIDVSNKLATAVDNVQKSYLSDVPEPQSIKKGAMIFAISADVNITSLERTNKEYKRSLLDGGELSKMKADNIEMKAEVETALKELLTSVDSYYETARKVVDYYKNKDYNTDLSKAVPYDEEMKTKYELYSVADAKMSAALKKYKPKRERKNPEDYSGDEAAVITLHNTYEDLLDKAETFFGDFQNIQKTTDVTAMQSLLGEMKSDFDANSKKVSAASFTDRTKYMKYNFEDYFSKTFNDFIKVTEKLLNGIKGGSITVLNLPADMMML